jgi:hypothetical protein
MTDLPEIWWSPSLAEPPYEGKVDPYAGMIWSHVSSRGYVTPVNLPDDAVRLVTTTDRQDRDARLMDALVKSESLEIELAAVEAAIQRVRDLHFATEPGEWICEGCSNEWPCPTIAALNGKEAS